MIYGLSGIIEAKKESFAVVAVAGVSFKVFLSKSTLADIPAVGEKIRFYTHLHVREDALDVYGFISEADLKLFESLIGINGVGPKSALSVMGVAKTDQIAAAIEEGRTELLTRAAGIGKKTAERIVLELRGKLHLAAASTTASLLESDLDVEEALVGLGYTRTQAKNALARVPAEIKGFHDRLKAALKKEK